MNRTNKVHVNDNRDVYLRIVRVVIMLGPCVLLCRHVVLSYVLSCIVLCQWF